MKVEDHSKCSPSVIVGFGLKITLIVLAGSVMNEDDYIIFKSKMSPAAEHIVNYFFEAKKTGNHKYCIKSWYDMLGALTAIGMSYYGEESTQAALKSALDATSLSLKQKSAKIKNS